MVSIFVAIMEPIPPQAAWHLVVAETFSSAQMQVRPATGSARQLVNNAEKLHLRTSRLLLTHFVHAWKVGRRSAGGHGSGINSKAIGNTFVHALIQLAIDVNPFRRRENLPLEGGLEPARFTTAATGCKSLVSCAQNKLHPFQKLTLGHSTGGTAARFTSFSLAFAGLRGNKSHEDCDDKSSLHVC
jgi:hypothetical protein